MRISYYKHAADNKRALMNDVVLDTDKYSNLKAFIISMLFNCYWALCVFAQNSAWPLLLAILIVAFVYDRFALVLAPFIALAGLGADFLLTGLGFYSFSYAEQKLSFGQALATVPFWLGFLWFGFATYACMMREVLKKYSIYLISILCAISGTLSYHAAARIGVVYFGDFVLTTIVLLTLWALYGYGFSRLILRAAEELDKTSATRKALFLKPGDEPL